MKANKVLVLGLDGMDSLATKKYLDAGLMPNLKKIIERGAAREDLQMIGGQPTVTPPMWTTLGTGAWPCTHGLTDFFRRTEDLDVAAYGCDSRYIKAEFLWNVAVESGKKALAWHWIAGWPPTSESENLHVVDGSQPTLINMGIAEVDDERFIIASEKTESVLYKSKMGCDSDIPCFIPGMEFDDTHTTNAHAVVNAPESSQVAISPSQTGHHHMGTTPLDYVFSPIKPASGWKSAPMDAKEFTILLSGGLLRRPCLLLKNDDGIYDHIAIYKTKQDAEPIVVLNNDTYTKDIVDEAIKNDQKITTVNRSMRILEIKPDGSELRLWISAGMDYSRDELFSPKELLTEIIDAVGYPQPNVLACGFNETLMDKILFTSWEVNLNWTAQAMKFLINKYDYDLVMSHFHLIDHLAHILVGELKGSADISKDVAQKYYQRIYMLADEYIGHFAELLDDGWTLFIVSDHGLICPVHEQSTMYAGKYAVNAIYMERWGYTVLKRDEHGNRLPEIDWSQTTAVTNRINHIYINLKGREKHGIVDPKDKYELEERIMSDLYALRDPVTGHRIITLALRNRDAMLLGHGGPESGDIVYYISEEFCSDHSDSLSTAQGAESTSCSSVFVAAGPGIKPGYTTRIIRHVDLTPTIATIMDLRMPHECEGAPIYQIINYA